MVELKLSLDGNALVKDLIDAVRDAIGAINFIQDGVTDSTPREGGRFVSVLADEQVISMYYHPDNYHRATASGKTQARSYAEAGKWAVAVAMRSRTGGNKTYYSANPEN